LFDVVEKEQDEIDFSNPDDDELRKLADELGE